MTHPEMNAAKALAEAIDAAWPVLNGSASRGSRKHGEAVAAALAEQGYVLVNAEGLAAALSRAPTMNDRPWRTTREHAEDILAAIQDSRLQRTREPGADR